MTRRKPALKPPIEHYNTPPPQFLEDVQNYLEHEDWRRVKTRDFMWFDPCVYCGDKADSWDHLDPESKGHRWLDNIARACQKCNGSKGLAPVVLFLAMRNTNRLPELHYMMLGTTLEEYHRRSKRTALWYQLTKLLAAKTK